MTTKSIALDDRLKHKLFIPTVRTRIRDHRFYTTMAFAMAAGIFAGFTPTYYARTHFHSPVIPLWVQIHGAVFTAWILFYLLQNLLAMCGGMKLHRNLGILGLILAIGVVFLGSAITFRQARQGRFFPFPDAASDLAISFAQMLLFGIFIALGLLWRRHAETHKRLMLMSSQLFFFPAFGRLLHGMTYPPSRSRCASTSPAPSTTSSRAAASTAPIAGECLCSSSPCRHSPARHRAPRSGTPSSHGCCRFTRFTDGKMNQVVGRDLLQRRRRRISGKDTEVPDHMHLIVIPRRMCDLCPTLRPGRPKLQRTAESGDSRQCRW